MMNLPIIIHSYDGIRAPPRQRTATANMFVRFMMAMDCFRLNRARIKPIDKAPRRPPARRPDTDKAVMRRLVSGGM